MKHQGKIAVVTGAGSGMGAATARLLQESGATVVLVDQNAEAIAHMAAENDGFQACAGDLRDSGFCDHVIKESMLKHGRVDILVNAAGVIARKDGLSTSDEEWQRVMDVNVNGLFYMSRAALGVMKTQRAGCIVNFGSIWGSAGAAGVLAYCASKGAVHQITRAMALETVSLGIRVNAVCPGEVNTAMLASERNEPVTPELMQSLADSVPMGRLAEPEEIARVVLFLSSDDASYMTGALVNVDAGYSA